MVTIIEEVSCHGEHNLLKKTAATTTSWKNKGEEKGTPNNKDLCHQQAGYRRRTTDHGNIVASCIDGESDEIDDSPLSKVFKECHR